MIAGIGTGVALAAAVELIMVWVAVQADRFVDPPAVGGAIAYGVLAWVTGVIMIMTGSGCCAP